MTTSSPPISEFRSRFGAAIRSINWSLSAISHSFIELPLGIGIHAHSTASMQFKKAVEDGKEGHVSCTCGSIRSAALVISRPPAYTLDRGEGTDFQEERRESR